MVARIIRHPANSSVHIFSFFKSLDHVIYILSIRLAWSLLQGNTRMLQRFLIVPPGRIGTSEPNLGRPLSGETFRIHLKDPDCLRNFLFLLEVSRIYVQVHGARSGVTQSFFQRLLGFRALSVGLLQLRQRKERGEILLANKW